MFKGFAHIPRNVHSLYFEGTKIVYLSIVIICDEHNIDVSGGFTAEVIQSDLGQ